LKSISHTEKFLGIINVGEALKELSCSDGNYCIVCLQDPPANVKEESLDVVPEGDNKMETEGEGASEKSSNPIPEVSCADKEIAQKTKDEELGVETANENKSHILSEETTVECCAERETVIQESDLPSTDEDKGVLCENVFESGEKSLTDTNEEKFPKEDTLIQDDTCPQNEESVPEVNNTVICDEKVRDHQSDTKDSVESSNCVRKKKRGHPKNPAVEENRETKRHKNKGCHDISAFSKLDLNNELESLAECFSDHEVFKRKANKLSRQHKKKLETKGTSVNGLGEDPVEKQRVRASGISSDMANELGFGGGEIHPEGVEHKNTEEEKEHVNITEKMPLQEVQADSGTDMQKMCNETNSSTPNIVAANGIEASSVLVLPIES
jgi:hypothetical protein